MSYTGRLYQEIEQEIRSCPGASDETIANLVAAGTFRTHTGAPLAAEHVLPYIIGAREMMREEYQWDCPACQHFADCSEETDDTPARCPFAEILARMPDNRKETT